MKFRPHYRDSAKLKYQKAHPQTTYVGASLTVAQRKIADKVTTSDAKYYIWCAGRQVGKSFTAVQILLWFALNRANSVNLFISMTYPQTLKVFKELYKGVKDSKIISSCNKSEHEIEFKNGSQIIFRSYQNAENSRGYHCSGIMIIDEAAFLGDNDFAQIYQPMLQNHKQSKCLLISSPKGENWFYKYYLKGCKHTSEGLLNKNFVSFKTTYKDNPFVDLKEIEEYRDTMPEPIFRQEILAEFVSNANSAFGESYSKCIISRKPPTLYNKKVFFGIDVAKENDYMVCVVMTDDGYIIDIYRKNKATFDSMADDIVQLVKKYHPTNIYLEQNSVGNVFLEMVQKKLNEIKYYDIEGWMTTNASKQDIVERLLADFQNRCVLIGEDVPYFDDLIDELDNFQVDYSTKTKAVIYGAKTGYHDDIVMALAICNKNRHIGNTKGLYGVA